MKAKLIGAPMNPNVNLVSHLEHAEELLKVARALAMRDVT
jgi:hypothetical protein